MVSSSRARNVPLTLVQRRIDDARRHVGDAAHTQHADAAVPRDNRLRHGGHADRVRAKDARHADFGRRFVRRAVHPHIHALLQGDAEGFRRLTAFFHQLHVISVGHVREACAEFGEVLARQRVMAGHVDEVGQHHQAALREIQVDPAGRVGDNERLHAEERHHAHRHGDILQVIPLIIVEAPLHHAHALPVEGACPPATGVTGCGGHRESGDVLVVDVLCIFEGIDVIAEPRTEDNADFSLSDALADGFGGGLETLHEFAVHGDDSFLNNFRYKSINMGGDRRGQGGERRLRLFPSPLVASAETKSPAYGKEPLCLEDQQLGRAHLARQCASSRKSSLGARLRTRKVTGRDASLPAPLLSAFEMLVAHGTVGALPQTPQGTLSLDPARGQTKRDEVPP